MKEKEMKTWDYYEDIFKEYNFNPKKSTPGTEDFNEFSYNDNYEIAKLVRNKLLFLWNWDIGYIDDIFRLQKSNNFESIDELKEIIYNAIADDVGFAIHLDATLMNAGIKALKDIFDKMEIEYEEPE